MKLEKAMGTKKRILPIFDDEDVGGGGGVGDGGGGGGVGIGGEKRNFIPRRSGGDKPYLSPEYEKDFHKKGSTRPVPIFGQNVQVREN